MGRFVALIFLACIASCYGNDTFWNRYVEFFNETLPNNSTLMEMWREHLKTWPGVSKTRAKYPMPPFNCHLSHAHNGHHATNVHELHPGDIRVVAALGDSLTAGNGILATNILGDLVEYRGHSWCIGGDGSLDSPILTMPNILKKFGQFLYGYSTGTGSRGSAGSRLNKADPGDTSYNMPEQAAMLVNSLKSDANVRYNDDWKLVTLFVGGNDLCDACNDHNKYSGANYANNIKQALDILHAQVPKVLVNVVQIFDIAPIAAMNGGFLCNLVHSFVCPCGKDKNNAALLDGFTRAYQDQTKALIDSGRYDTRSDFTAVLQPFFTNTRPPTHSGTNMVDLSYFSPDCFHFNEKGHGAAALSLWNNMFEAPGSKQLSWHLDQDFHCPGTHGDHGHEFITTKMNANGQFVLGKK
ncbi:phospholipase B1, membrane-associated [Mytilus galloprovincialis]|uniref:Phospholipase B1, membrane-associated n=1 Tax=Mytilus galloprovincialis TaxID=29158 RepID=A0A8B6BNG8_MYTGA|nr:phospholipase B1, membrane-associated [Mytilus galloprovincialis]